MAGRSYLAPDPPIPLWEAVDSDGVVKAAWVERGGYQTPEWIRECAAKYHPGLRLRVTRFEATTTWDGEEADSPRKSWENSVLKAFVAAMPATGEAPDFLNALANAMITTREEKN